MNLDQKNILIIQLARSGDLAQTAQAIRNAKQTYPKAKFYLLARDQFAKPVYHILENSFDELVLMENLSESLKDNQDLRGLRSKLRDVIKLVDDLEIDVLFNFTFNKSSSYLASLIKAKTKYGPYRNKSNQIEIKDIWSQYIYSNVLGNTVNPFNLVDLFSFALGVKNFVTTPTYKKVGKSIIIHPYASNSKKRWNTHKWVNFLHHLIEELDYKSIFVVGSNADQEETNHIINHHMLKDKNLVPFIGKSSEQLVSLFKDCRLFIGHDSLISHIAAYTNTPSLVLSLGSVRPNDTTPYNELAYNVAPRISCFPCKLESSCDDYACHDKLDINLILALSKEIFDHEIVRDEFLLHHSTRKFMAEVDIYGHEKSDNGLIQFKLNQGIPDTKEIFLHFYTVLWQFYLRDFSVNVPYSKLDADCLDGLYQYQLATTKIKRLFEFACKYSENLAAELREKKVNNTKLAELMNRLAEIDKMLFEVVRAYPYLSPLVNLFFVKKNNSSGERPYDIAISSQLTFFEAVNMTKALSELLEQTLIFNQYKSNIVNGADV